MSVNHSEETKAGESLFGVQRYLIRFVAVLVVLLIVVPLLPGLISNLAYSFSGEAPKLYWYLSRSAGFVALTILWLSMMLGLAISNKMARIWPGAPAAFAIHEFVSLLGLAFAVYHGLVLMGDHFVDFSLPRLLVPFSIAYETFWVGLGQVSFYVWAVVTATFYVRRWIGPKTWRLIHYVNFATYAMGILHGIFSGTDSSVGWVHWYYLISAGSLLVLLGYRLHEVASKRNFSLVTAIKQRSQDLTRAATALKSRTLPQIKERILALLPRSPRHLSEASQADASDFKSAIAPQTAEREMLEPQQSEVLVTEEQSPSHINSASEVPGVPAAEEKMPPPALVETYEQGSGKNRIKIRIYKEPPEEQIILKPQRQAAMKQVDLDLLILKLKKFFRVTPIQPEKSEERPGRVRLLDD